MVGEARFPQIVIQISVTEGIQKECGNIHYEFLTGSAQSFNVFYLHIYIWSEQEKKYREFSLFFLGPN